MLAGITDEYTAADVVQMKLFKQANHLHVDGVIGGDTFTALLLHFDALGTQWYESFGAVSGYVNPLKDAQQLTLERTDQGVDYFAKKGSPILAMGKATITRSTTKSGWCAGDPSPDAHGCVQYRLLDGDHAGEEIYVAEYIEPLVKEGDVVEAGHVIARFLCDPSVGASRPDTSGSGRTSPATARQTAPRRRPERRSHASFARWAARRSRIPGRERPTARPTHETVVSRRGLPGPLRLALHR